MYLDKIIEKKMERLKEVKRGGAFKNAIEKEGISIIGEFKKASPSKGIILENFNLEKIIGFYNEVGIDAYSILTERDFFMGSSEHLRVVREVCSTPILRKDFIIDKYQIYESKVIGADGILLIAGVLQKKLSKFYNIAKEIGLDVLVEVHNEEELKYALDCDADIIGINNRDLNTFNVNLKKTEAMLKRIPKGKLVVSESGVGGICDIEHLSDMGVDCVLIGELFMRNLENEAFKNEFKKFRKKYRD